MEIKGGTDHPEAKGDPRSSILKLVATIEVYKIKQYSVCIVTIITHPLTQIYFSCATCIILTLCPGKAFLFLTKGVMT